MATLKLVDKLEIALDRLVQKNTNYNDADKKHNKLWVYESFANWLVRKFEEDKNIH